jgi:hypothetical protein
MAQPANTRLATSSFRAGAAELESIATNPKDPAFFLLWAALGLAGVGAGFGVVTMVKQLQNGSRRPKY